MKPAQTIRRCGIKFRKRCPLAWEALAATSDASVRSCATCDRLVYFCTTDEETLQHAREGHCIARSEPRSDALPPIVLGEPERPARPMTDDQKDALAWRGRERGIAEAISSELSPTDRACPACSYPVPDWRATCYVCDLHLGRR